MIDTHSTAENTIELINVAYTLITLLGIRAATHNNH